MTAGPDFRMEGEVKLSFGSLTTLGFGALQSVVRLRCSLTLWFEKEKRGRRCPREIRKLIEQNTDCLMFLHTLPRYPVPSRETNVSVFCVSLAIFLARDSRINST